MEDLGSMNLDSSFENLSSDLDDDSSDHDLDLQSDAVCVCTLGEAAECSNWYLVEKLLCGDVQAIHIHEHFLLHMLAAERDISPWIMLDILDILIAHGVDVNLPDDNGDVPIQVAACCDNWDLVMELFLFNAQTTDKTDSQNRTLLQYLGDNTTLDDRPDVQFLLLQQIVSNPSDLPSTVVYWAGRYEKWNFVKYLAQIDFDLNVLGSGGLTILHMLIIDPPEEVDSLIRLVLAHGGRVDTPGANGDTALHLAAKMGKWEIMKLLLRNDAYCKTSSVRKKGGPCKKGTLCSSLDSEHMSMLHRLIASPETWNYTYHDMVDLMIDEGLDINVKNSYGNTALQMASKQRKWEVVKYLLKNGADFNLTDSENYTLLHRIAEDGAEWLLDGLLQLALEKGADVFVRDPMDNTPIQIAAKHGHWRFVNTLLKYKANLNETDSEGYTILLRAAHVNADEIRNNSSFLEVVKFVLERSSHIDLQDPNGETALQLAARNNCNLMIMLLEKGASTKILDKQRFSVLHKFATKSETSNHLIFTYSHWSTEKIVKVLLENGANLHSKDIHGNTALHTAVQHNNWTLTKELMKHGADVNDLDGDGFCVLHRLSMTENYNWIAESVLKNVLEVGANINLPCSRGDTALHLAAKHENWSIVRKLLELDACANVPDSEGFYIQHRLAISPPSRSGQLDILQLLHDKGAQLDTFSPQGKNLVQMAAECERWDIVQWLLTGSRLADVVYTDDFFILHTFVQSKRASYDDYFSGNKSIVDLLIANGVDVDCQDRIGRTALYLAASKKRWTLVEHLLSKGASIAFPPLESCSLLHLFTAECAEDQHKQKNLGLLILEKIIDSNIDVNMKDSSNDTPILLAARNGHWDIVQRLLSLVIDINTIDKEGFTVLHRVANSHNYFGHINADCIEHQVAQSLLNMGAKLDIVCSCGDTALQLAAKRDNWLLVNALLDKGAQLGTLDSKEMNVVHRLAKSRTCSDDLSLQLLSKFVSLGTDVDKTNSDGYTALQIAFEREKWFLVQHLLEICINAEPFDRRGNTFFHMIANCDLQDTGRWQQITHTPDTDTLSSVTSLLLKHKVDINKYNMEGDTALHIAARENRFPLMKIFLAHGADVLAHNKKHGTVLHVMATCYRETSSSLDDVSQILKLVVEKGIDLNEPDSEGKSPFQIALLRTKWSILWRLVEAGATYELSDSNKTDILQHLQEFPQNIVDEEKLYVFIKYITNDCANIDKITTLSTFLFFRIPQNVVPLELSISYSNWTAAKSLIMCGADITKPSDGQPLLHRVILKYDGRNHDRWLSLLDVLLDRGVDINCLNQENRTVLQKVMQTMFQRDDFEIVLQVLLQRGANPLAVDASGHSLLRQAIDKHNALSLVKLLIEAGVSTHQPRLTDTASPAQGQDRELGFAAFRISTKSPTEKALLNENITVVKILVETGASSASELWRLYIRFLPELTKDAGRVQNAELLHKSAQVINRPKKLLEIVEQAVTNPRSLKSLCRLVISHSVACGANRRARVMSLPIPAPLKEYVLFADVLAPEFLVHDTEKYPDTDLLPSTLSSPLLAYDDFYGDSDDDSDDAYYYNPYTVDSDESCYYGNDSDNFVYFYESDEYYFNSD